jgi:DNA primase large subunit
VDEAERKLYQKELHVVSPPLPLPPSGVPPDERIFKVKAFHSPKDPVNYATQVRWTRVPDLVEKRKVFLKGGWAYVPVKEQSSIVFQEFETNMVNALQVSQWDPIQPCTFFLTASLDDG